MAAVRTLDLARRIKSELRASAKSSQLAVEHARAAGRLLVTAKKQLSSHGDWLPWLRDHCGLSPRTAQGYMKLATLSPAQAKRVAHLPLREALRTTAVPKAVSLQKIYQVVVTCKAETDQRDLLERLIQEGFQCRALMS